jgi:hypothetical protein
VFGYPYFGEQLFVLTRFAFWLDPTTWHSRPYLLKAPEYRELPLSLHHRHSLYEAPSSPCTAGCVVFDSARRKTFAVP